MPVVQIYYCSFCHKHQSKVGKIIAGPDRINICDECIDLAYDIIHPEENKKVLDKADEMKGV